MGIGGSNDHLKEMRVVHRMPSPWPGAHAFLEGIAQAQWSPLSSSPTQVGAQETTCLWPPPDHWAPQALHRPLLHPGSWHRVGCQCVSLIYEGLTWWGPLQAGKRPAQGAPSPHGKDILSHFLCTTGYNLGTQSPSPESPTTKVGCFFGKFVATSFGSTPRWELVSPHFE